MPFEDWTVEVIDVSPLENHDKNPLTGLAIDPEGLMRSLVQVRMTHITTGKVLNRADAFTGVITEDSIKDYVRPHTNAMDAAMIVQRKKDGTPSPLAGPLDITIPAAVDPRTPDEIKAANELNAFQQAQIALDQKVALVEKLKDASPADATALDAEVEKLKSVRDTAAAPVIAALTKP